MKRRYGFNIGIVVFMVVLALGINFFREDMGSRAVISQNEKSYIAIVIDDMGGGAEGTEEILDLPIKFTGAVMPNQSRSDIDAALLIANGDSVLAHIPMEAKKGKRSWLGESPILTELSDDEIREILSAELDGKPFVGANNHMGSRATEDPRIMDILFSELSERGLIFLDSMTTPDSLSGEYGEKYGVPVLKRDVFLDSTDSKEEVINNLNKTKEIAKKKGYAICIGHVGAEGGLITAEAIKEVCDDFEKDGIEFVTVEKILSIKKDF